MENKEKVLLGILGATAAGLAVTAVRVIKAVKDHKEATRDENVIELDVDDLFNE